MRLDYFTNPVTSKAVKYLASASHVVDDSSLPQSTAELVRLRASQINGCGFCVDMHTKDAAAAGETTQRLHLVAAWRDATVFTDAERAALELAEQGTVLGLGTEGISDEAWSRAAQHFSDDELGALVAGIAVINAFNRMNVLLRRPASDYQPGQFK